MGKEHFMPPRLHQTIAFRRSKPPEKIPKIKLKSGRSKSVSDPPGLFELRDAKMGSQKPPPNFMHPFHQKCMMLTQK